MKNKIEKLKKENLLTEDAYKKRLRVILDDLKQAQGQRREEILTYLLGYLEAFIES